MPEQDMVIVLNRIADEIGEFLKWFREQKEQEAATKTRVPPVEYTHSRMLNGQWPLRDGNSYGKT